MSPHRQPEQWPAAAAERRRLLRKFGRRIAAAVVRGRIGRHPWNDDLANFRHLLLAPERSRASCPICGYRGPFLQHARQPREICLRCQSRARHRTIHLALERRALAGVVALHLAPHPAVARLLRARFSHYLSGDLVHGRGDLALDLRRLPFNDDCLDLVFASHVLEHIVEDRAALAEIRRVLSPRGVAVLIVPIEAPETVDWGAADPRRNDHVRVCGLDYLDRYREAGFAVEQVGTDDFPDPEHHALASWRDGRRTVHWVAFCTPEPT